MLTQLIVAQATATDVGLSPETLVLSSVGVVSAITLVIVQKFVKPLLTNVPALGKVPVVAYTVVIAAVLTWLANRVVKTLPGDNLGQLVLQACAGAVAAGGIYKIPSALQPLQNTKQPPDSPAVGSDPVVPNTPSALGATTPDPKLANSGVRAYDSAPVSDFRTPNLVLLLILPAVAFLAVGCQAPTTSPFYNGVAAQWPPIKATYTREVNADAGLTPDRRAILLESANTMDALIAREGQRLRNAKPSTTQP